jgi:purine-nucleoside phosphorylase
MREAMERFREEAESAVHYLAARIGPLPEIILVLGTGLGGLADRIDDALTIPYHEIPHFPHATVESHAGNLIVGALGGKRVAALQGRFHFYEGYSTRELTRPVRVLSLLGAKTLVVSNAAGGLNPDFAPGTIMLLRDHINLIPDNPLRGANIDAWGPRFPDFSAPYDQPLMATMLRAAARLGTPNVTSGIYVAIPGPSLETPAETRYLRSIGADAVGMSTVPEVIVAVHAGLKVLGISVVANVNDPDNFKPIRIEEIIDETRKCEERLQELLVAFVREI